MRKVSYAGMLLSIYTVSTDAHAESLLLATYHRIGGDGHAPMSAPALRFQLELVGDGAFPPGPTLTGPFLENHGSGVFDITPENSQDFNAFAQLATNGVNDSYYDMVQWFDLTGGASVGFENQLFHQGETGILSPPDLAGNELDFIRLTVNNVDIMPLIGPMGEEGFFADFDIAYEFYGMPIPEPRSGILLFWTVSILLWATGRRQTSFMRM